MSVPYYSPVAPSLYFIIPHQYQDKFCKSWSQSCNAGFGVDEFNGYTDADDDFDAEKEASASPH